MPTIRKRNGQYQVQVRLLGAAPLSKTFAQYADAKAWGLEQERKLKLGDVPTERRKELQTVTLGGLIDWYRQDRALNPHKRKRSYGNEDIALQAFQKRDSILARKSLAELRQKDFFDYIDRRLAAGVKAATVRRELNPIRHIFKVARLERDLPAPDLFRGIALPAEEPGRDRILTKDERNRLFAATGGCRGEQQRRLWWLMITAAEESALRRGELLKLTWSDIDFEKGLLRVRAENTKTRKARLLPMGSYLRFFLRLYYIQISPEDQAPDKPVFPITPTAHSQAWRRITNRAKLENLHFHDLRHVAATRYDELGLTRSENEYMLGHKGRSMNDRYNHAEIERIRAKLDVGAGELPKDDVEVLVAAACLARPDDYDGPMELVIKKDLAVRTGLLQRALDEKWGPIRVSKTAAESGRVSQRSPLLSVT